MKIQDNSRQIPKDKTEYLSNIKYCDALYAYLQVISKWSGKPGDLRYIPKKDCTFVQLASALNMNRQTVSKKFKAMLEGEEGSIALIRKEGKNYVLLPIEKRLAMLVPYGTLQVLTSTVQEKVISIYVYLLNRYIASKERPFRYTIDELKAVVGLSTDTRSNNYIISSILLLLKKLGLLNYEKKIECDETVSYITFMTNEIDELPEELKDEYGASYDALLKKCS